MNAVKKHFKIALATAGLADLPWHRFLPLRSRYLLTRKNMPRLRYVLGSMVALGLAVSFGPDISFSSRTPDDAARAALVAQAAEGAAKGVTGFAVKPPQKDSESLWSRHFSNNIHKASLALKKPPVPYKTVKIGTGDTLGGVLQQAGLSGRQAYLITQAMKGDFDPRKIRAGQELTLHYKNGDRNPEELEKVTMRLDPVKDLVIHKAEDDSFKAELNKKKIVEEQYAGAFEIQTSLYGSALQAGLPVAIISEVIRAYSWDVDFQRDIRRGDVVKVLYTAQQTEDGHVVRYDNVLFANLSIGGKEKPIYRYKTPDGRIDYYEPDGQSIRKTLMKTPIDGARLSSGYGMRKHPVLGYNKMHKGVDFAAATGTPIYAAGDGVIDYIGRYSSYGNYIRIRHNSTLKTAYAHLHKFKSGLTKGKRVEQGDVIGYVGTTGRSTGPHLHYEVLVNNVQKNPSSVDLPIGEQLKGKTLSSFKQLVKNLNDQYITLAEGFEIAQRVTGEKQNAIR